MGDIDEPRSHYHFRISLRFRHPSMAPEQITEAMGFEPKRSWKAGEPRQTPKGTPLAGINRETCWTVDIVVGRWPLDLNEAIHDTLKRLVRYRSFLHHIRTEGGIAELFIGWCFESQSGDVLTRQCLALAGDLQIDLSLDIYPPDQPQHEYEVENPLLRQ
ncbi:MAG TPA: DUF4279 domain-containing protein [Terriglobales bacterium]|nr:DUF4279 domain-containing protein [Terriglobales bacterium]